MAAGYWQHFDHQADIGIRGVGPSPEEAFAQAAMALTAIVTDPDRVRPVQEETLHCQAPQLEILFVDWINAVIYAMTTRYMLFAKFQVNIRDQSLQASLFGERVDRQRHEPAVEIKGATFTELGVFRRDDGNWCAQCVVDV